MPEHCLESLSCAIHKVAIESPDVIAGEWPPLRLLGFRSAWRSTSAEPILVEDRLAKKYSRSIREPKKHLFVSEWSRRKLDLGQLEKRNSVPKNDRSFPLKNFIHSRIYIEGQF
jgi:hypothetical protein